MKCIELNVEPKCGYCKAILSGRMTQTLQSSCAIESWRKIIKKSHINDSIRKGILYINHYSTATPYFLAAVKIHYPEFIDIVNKLMILK